MPTIRPRARCDTALGPATRLRATATIRLGWRWGAGEGARGVRQGSYDTATRACDTAGPLPRHDQGLGHNTVAMRAPGRASAHLGVPVGPAGCSCIWLGFSNWFLTRFFFPESIFGRCS